MYLSTIILIVGVWFGTGARFAKLFKYFYTKHNEAYKSELLN